MEKISNTPLTVIVGISLALKLFFFICISPWNPKVENEKILVSDSWGYEKMAENVLKYHSFGPPVDTCHITNFSDYRLPGYLSVHPDSYRMPLYPAFMAIIYCVTGIRPYLIIIFQIILSLFSVVLVYRICMLLFNNLTIAKLAAILFALDIQSAFVANQLLTDTLFIVLFLTSSLFFLKGIILNKLKFILLSGIFLGLTVLTKGMILLYPVIILFLIITLSKQNYVWKIKSIVLYFVAFILLAASWSFRNKLKFGHFEFATQDGIELLMYNAAFTETRMTHENIDSVRVKFQKKADSLGFREETDLFKQSAIYTKLAVIFIKNNKTEYIKTHLLGGVNMYLSLGNVGMSQMLGWESNRRQEAFAEINSKRIWDNFKYNSREALLGIIILCLFIIQYSGALVGSILLFKSKQYLILFLFLMTAAYFAAIAGVVGTYRYKLTVVPFICIVSGYAYVTIKMSENALPGSV